MAQAAFIVLDGNDGSGKATQARMLETRLRQEDIPCIRLDFPRYTDNFFGGFIGECLAGQHGDFTHLSAEIASALYALDRLESSAAIRDALAGGKVVIGDRFSSSNQIHQGGKIADESERVAFLEWLDKMEHEVLGIPRPDAILYLEVPVDLSLRLLSENRAKKNQHLGQNEKDMVEGDREYLERSHAAADWLVARQPNWKRISCIRAGALRSKEDIHNEIWESVCANVGSH